MDTPLSLPAPIAATLHDLPAAVAEALTTAPAPERGVTVSGGVPFAWRAWGDPISLPIVLVHGVGGSSAQFWRVGPAVAASGRRVVAPDLPGHGLTGHWQGRHLFRQTAEDLVGFIQSAGLDLPGLVTIGHSWGALTVSLVVASGLQPERLVLLDGPAVPRDMIARMADDPVEKPYPDLTVAVAAIQAAYPSWTAGDIHAKAEGLTQLDEGAVRAVLLDNGDWDGGLAGLRVAAEAGVPGWIIRGVLERGGYLPDAWLPAFAAVIGADHILTVADGAHSPYRAHPEATVAALLRALA